MKDKLWILRDIDNDEALKLSQNTGISALLAKVFLSRGIRDEEYIKKFINPSLKDLHDPFLLKDMNKAVDRVIFAIENNEKIVIYGDYDVDGVTSTSILWDLLKNIDANVDYYIPDRLEEGYGLSIGAIDKVIKMGASLIITVDCGVTANNEVEYINEKGLEVIITDHHECNDQLPNAHAIINPHRPDCNYPFKELAGVGVAFKFAEALSNKIRKISLRTKYLDLVALGTVADVVPLLGENRVIVKFGLELLENTSNIGLIKLMELADLNKRKVSTYLIGFGIAPRINAAGRIKDASKAVKLLTTENEEEAVKIAVELNEHNKYRQEEERQILDQVIETVDKNIDLNIDKVIVVAKEGWHHGIVGIVASKISEKYCRPVILISIDNGLGKGSGRSVEGFNLFLALQHCQVLFERYGGHELAAGLTIKEENIELFREEINNYARSIMEPSCLIPKVKIDVSIKKEDVSITNIKELNLLAPFGASNPDPVFKYSGLKLNTIRCVGKNKSEHLKLYLEDGEDVLEAMGYYKAHKADLYSECDIIDVVCSLEINEWNNKESIQLNLKDLCLCEETLIENKYYYSLNKAINLGNRKNHEDYVDFLKTNANISVDYNESFIEEVVNKGKVIFFVNSLESLKQIGNNFKKLSVKRKYRICYNVINTNNDWDIYILVNPVSSLSVPVDYTKVFYGNWAWDQYFFEIVKTIKNERIYFKDISFDWDKRDLIVDRQDMVVVYQYIKSNYQEQFLIEDLFLFTRFISSNYKVKINYFKLVKILEIFNELNLIETELCGKCGAFIKTKAQNSKVDILNSKIFRSFNLLKKT